MLRFEERAEYLRFREDGRSILEARWLWGQRLRDATANSGKLSGWCGTCAALSIFTYQAERAGPIDLREEMGCESCGLSARMRVSLGLVRELAGSPNARIFATEQATPGFRWLIQRFPDAIGSEYFSEDQRPRLTTVLESLLGRSMPLRFEDATCLDMPDDWIDVLMSCDVLEHIPDYQAALREFGRVVRPGGHLVLTIPFLDADESSILRARIDESGEIEHLVEPEYHGDPVSDEGILAFHSFGWSLLGDVRSAGFTQAHWCLPWDPFQGVFSGLWTLHAVRA